MTETIYEKKMYGNLEEDDFCPPGNRRQIGNPGQAEMEVFIEDYAYTFAKKLSEKDYSGCTVGILTGDFVRTGGGSILLIKGVLEAGMTLVHEKVCFTEETWAEIYRGIREHFPGQQIVGWFFGGPGFLLEDEEQQKKILTDNFGGGDKVLLKMDSVEREATVLIYQTGRLEALPGYYIYYERNEAMRNYMLRGRLGVEAPAVPGMPYREADWKLTVQRAEDMEMHPRQGKEEMRPAKIQTSSLYRLFYATGGMLACLALAVITALSVQINEKNKLSELLNRKEELVSSIQEVHEVAEGETIESICMAQYGTEELAGDIRILNGLDEGENPEAGSKLFLP